MAKMNITLEQLREKIVARKTKGAAFMKGDYAALMRDTRVEVAAFTFEELKAKYPTYTYDVGIERKAKGQ